VSVHSVHLMNVE